MNYTMLNNGIEMPMLGFGVYQIDDDVQCEQVVLEALSCGYRMIDTAASYGNEEAVGRAIEESGILRREIFVTTKLWVQDYSYKGAKKAFENSIDKLGLEYVDLYLLHQPLGDYYGAYRAMEELYMEGRVRAIGVSNFRPDRLMDLCMHAQVVPAVNQEELHPFYQKEEDLQWLKELDIQPQGWAPLNEGMHKLLHHPVLTVIGEKYGKTAAQVALRWNIQRGVSVIPKSVCRKHMRQNIDIWDFSLSEEDMEMIKTMDIGYSEIIDTSKPETVKELCGRKIHD